MNSLNLSVAFAFTVWVLIVSGCERDSHETSAANNDSVSVGAINEAFVNDEALVLAETNLVSAETNLISQDEMAGLIATSGVSQALPMRSDSSSLVMYVTVFSGQGMMISMPSDTNSFVAPLQNRGGGVPFLFEGSRDSENYSNRGCEILTANPRLNRDGSFAYFSTNSQGLMRQRPILP